MAPDEQIEHDRLFIGGRWAPPAGTGRIEVVSPHTEEPLGSVPAGTAADVGAAVAAARAAFDAGPCRGSTSPSGSPRSAASARCTTPGSLPA